MTGREMAQQLIEKVGRVRDLVLDELGVADGKLSLRIEVDRVLREVQMGIASLSDESTILRHQQDQIDQTVAALLDALNDPPKRD